MEFLQREELIMATQPIDRPVTPLRQRMLDDMAMRAMGARTQHDYVRHVRAFAGFLKRSPDTATAEDVRRFQLHQREHGVGESTISGTVSALRFLFGVSEVAHLKVDDLDSERMLLRIEEGKGRKDRNAMLSPQLLELLRLWWREGKRRSVLLPHGWLFPGRSYTDPISTRQLHRAVCEAAEAAGIRKRVSPHTLRHSFATHLLEQDVDIRVIQVLLGHSKLETTALYTKVATRTIRAVTSPLDRLMALMEGKTPAG